jgi:hypothetical protein
MIRSQSASILNRYPSPETVIKRSRSLSSKRANRSSSTRSKLSSDIQSEEDLFNYPLWNLLNPHQIQIHEEIGRGATCHVYRANISVNASYNIASRGNQALLDLD